MGKSTMTNYVMDEPDAENGGAAHVDENPCKPLFAAFGKEGDDTPDDVARYGAHNRLDRDCYAREAVRDLRVKKEDNFLVQLVRYVYDRELDFHFCKNASICLYVRFRRYFDEKALLFNNCS